MSELKGLKINLTVSEPWDFGTANGNGPFPGELIKVFSSPKYPHGLLAIGKLSTPFVYKEVQYNYLFIQPRHVDEKVEQISNNVPISCNVSPIEKDCAEADDPLSDWKGAGEGVLIGQISKA